MVLAAKPNHNEPVPGLFEAIIAHYPALAGISPHSLSIRCIFKHIHATYRLYSDDKPLGYVLKHFRFDPLLTDAEGNHLQSVERAVMQLQQQGRPVVACCSGQGRSPLLLFHHQHYGLYPFIDNAAQASTQHIDRAQLLRALIAIHTVEINMQHTHLFSAARWAHGISTESLEQTLAHPTSNCISKANRQVLLRAGQQFMQHRDWIDRDGVFAHSDLTPQNVLQDTHGQIHIIDFESAGRINRHIDLFNVAVNWLGIGSDTFTPRNLDDWLTHYAQLSGIRISLQAHHIYASLGSWLAWINRCLQLLHARHHAGSTEDDVQWILSSLDASIRALIQLEHLAHNRNV